MWTPLPIIFDPLTLCPFYWSISAPAIVAVAAIIKVAITRARLRLWIVGDLSTLEAGDDTSLGSWPLLLGFDAFEVDMFFWFFRLLRCFKIRSFKRNISCKQTNGFDYNGFDFHVVTRNFFWSKPHEVTNALRWRSFIKWCRLRKLVQATSSTCRVS